MRSCRLSQGRFLSGTEKVPPKNFCDKDFAELSGELSGAICLKTLVLLGSALELFRQFFGTVGAIFWVWGSFLAPDFKGSPSIRLDLRDIANLYERPLSSHLF